jgi:tRNA(Ile)-lysidine synthetase-like protein
MEAKSLKNFIRSLIQPNDSLLLAISGGIDSMVMLDYIFNIKEEFNLKISIAHVNHQTRPSNELDLELINYTAKKLKIPFFVKNLDKTKNQNFHDYAHKERYDFFYQLAKENNIDKIVLAHNANDNSETILMRLSRGSSFDGYIGILEQNLYKGIKIIRPLLRTSKAEIIDYQKTNNIKYLEDPSNQENDYTRNRFRHQILPFFESENPKYLEKFSQFSYYQKQAYLLIESYTDKLMEKFTSNSIDLLDFNKQFDIIKIEILKKMINRLTFDSVELSFQNFLDIIELCNSEKPHLRFELENQLYIEKSYQTLTFSRNLKEFNDYHFIIDDFKEIRLPYDNLLIISENQNKNYGFIYKLCYNNLDLLFPLTVRNRRDGDRVKTSAGSKKIKDLMIDKKIPLNLRNTLPVILDKFNDIILVPGIYQKQSSGKNELYIGYKKG